MNREMRLIAVGCGRVFERYHLPAIRAVPTVQLAGLVEVDRSRQAWARQTVPDVPCTESIAEALQAERADAALISTPPETHASLIEAALRAGLAVLVEKPMTLTVPDARRVCDLQRRTGSVLRVGFNRRYRRDYARVRRRIDGLVDEVGFTFIADAQRWNAASACTPSFVLHDAGSHAVDLVAYLVRAPVVRLRAADASTRDACMVTLDVVLEGGTPASCTVGHATHHRERLSVRVGARGLRVTASTTPLNRIGLALRKLTRRLTPTAESFREQLTAFARAWGGEADGIGADAADGLASVVAMEAALRSLADGGSWQDLANRL